MWKMDQISHPKRPSQLEDSWAAAAAGIALTAELLRALETLSEARPATRAAFDGSDAMAEDESAAHHSVASWREPRRRKGGAGRGGREIGEVTRFYCERGKISGCCLRARSFFSS